MAKRIPALTTDQLPAYIESILFVAEEAVGVPLLMQSLRATRDAIEDALAELEQRCLDGGGTRLQRDGDLVQLVTAPEAGPHVERFLGLESRQRLSGAALESLAIIAYRQPMTAPEISDIRGVNSSGVLRTLLDRRMIRIAGRKAVVGSPFLYRTTREFLMHFGLNAIQDLPRLEEFGDLLGDNVAEVFLSEAQNALVERGPAEGHGAVEEGEPIPEIAAEDSAVEDDGDLQDVGEGPREAFGDNDVAPAQSSSEDSREYEPSGELEEEGSETERKTVEFPGNDND
jgi:segregation and condensation protein B